MEDKHWYVHYVTNDDKNGHVQKYFPKGICNAHTHGMWQFDVPEFQFVLDIGAKDTGCVLNRMGEMVKSGKRFHYGEILMGLMPKHPERRVKIYKAKESGKEVMRLVVEDVEGNFPEDLGCLVPFNKQMFNLDD